MAGLVTFETRDAAAAHVATLIEGALVQQLAAAGTASLLLSGGSTPGPVMEHLSRSELDWSNIMTGLVDERWVPLDDPRSNAGLVHSHLLQNRAAASAFLPMYTEAASTLSEAAPMIDTAYASLMETNPVTLLGMGPDGHTASWFPGVSGLEAVIDSDGSACVLDIDATGAPVAGDMPYRMTITAAALARAGLTVLYITGEEKRAVLEAKDKDLPIHHAERVLGHRLIKVWAP